MSEASNVKTSNVRVAGGKEQEAGPWPLPEGWVWTTLGKIRVDKSQSITPGKTSNQVFELYSVPSFAERKPEIITGQDIGSNKRTVEKNVVLLCKINPRINRVWVVGDHSSWPKIASTEWIPFFQVDGILPDYLCYFMQQNTFRDFLSLHASGVGGSLMRVNPNTFAYYPFPLPPLPEQERIVAWIETEMTRLEAGVAALKRARVALGRYKASVLKAACEGRLVPTEAELARMEGRDYEPADRLLGRILAERRARWEAEHPGKRYEVPAAPELSALPPLPEGWCWATVEQINPVHRICAYGVLQPGPHIESGIPLIRVGDIQEGKISTDSMKRIAPEIAEQYQRTTLEGGEVLISLVGAIGRTAVVPLTLSGANTARAVGVIPIHNGLLPAWIEIWLRNPEKIYEMTQKAHEVARKTLNLEDVRAATIALPPLVEQERIVAEVERRMSVAAEVEATLDAALARAERLRQSILKRAFEGRGGSR